MFSNVAQWRTSLSIWPWNALWDPAKRVSLTTWGQSNKSKPLSDLALISEVCSLMEPKISNHPGGQQDSLKREWKASVKNACKSSKSDRERQVAYDITYLWNLKKMIQMNLFTKQK